MANPKLSTLQDFFGAPVLNAAVWNNSSGAPNVTLDPVLDRVQINCTSGYPAFGGNGPYDFTADSLSARISPPPIGTGTTQFIQRVVVDANNRASLFFDGGGILTATVVNAGVSTTTTIGTYDPYSHAWWRLREASGNVLFDTSPDGWTWTTQATIAHTWAATAVQVIWICGYFGTEAAGLAGYLDHVNTTASATGQPNLNWPLIEDGWGTYWNANAGAMPADRFVEITDRTRNQVTVSRGRQYELDQVRSGEASLTLANADAVLDPVNTAGPFYGHIAPYQPYRRRAQWPPTRNLLDQAPATGGDAGGFPAGTISSSATNIFSSTDSTGGSFVTSTTAWLGSTVMQFAVPSATAATSRIFHTPRWSPIPGQTYTLQLRVRDITAATSLSVQAFIGWYTSGGGNVITTAAFGTASVLTGSTTAAWTTLTVTATAPANAVGMDIGAVVGATAAATCSIQVDGVQLEKGATATTWQCPGVWSPVYAGFTERWTPQWDMHGTYGLVQPTAVDTFSLLSQQKLADTLTQEINAHAPRFVYKLDDPAGSTSATDWTGNFPAAQLGISKYGAGSWVWGTTITSTDATGTYTGSSGSVATLNNPSPGQNIPSAATFLKLGSAGIAGPADPTVWVRMIAFRYTGPTPTNVAFLWSSMDGQRANGVQSGSFIRAVLGSDGKPYVQVAGPTGAAGNYLAGGATNCVDGDWHLLLFGYNQATQQVMASQDGAAAAFYGSVPTTYTPTGIITDTVGAYVDGTVGNGTLNNFKGDLSFVCEFGSFFDSTAITNLYTAWKSSCAGESSNARYARILRYAGYTGATALDTGLTTSMGPANLDGQDAMSALQAVVDTENGSHYVDKAGGIVFRARSARYNATTPQYTFGESAAAGEYPYEDCQLDYDSTHLSNDITVTQEGTGQNFYATDAASVTAYFTRTMSRTINASNADECQDAAGYLLSRYRQPAQRVSSIKLHPSACPALWPVCLALELGTRVRVMRRPPGLPPIQVDCFVENIAWEFDDNGEAFQILQCSPADLTPYGVFGAWHTTLAAASSSGATSISVNAPQTVQLYSTAFDTAGTWRSLSTDGNATDLGAATIVSDAGDNAARGTGYTILESTTELPYDPTLTYRVSATIRTATAPTTGTSNVYVGLTGIRADGTRCNINGAAAVSSQIYCAARGTAPTATYTTFTGYVSGTATPGDAGPNTDPASPQKVRPEIVRVRPLVYLLYTATDGVQYMTSFTVHTVPTGGGVPLAAQLAPGQQIVVGQGGPVPDTMTVASVGATSPGWITGTITFTAGMAHSHTNGFSVSEPLPAGITDPTTWDTVDKFDSITFAY